MSNFDVLTCQKLAIFVFPEAPFHNYLLLILVLYKIQDTRNFI